MKIRIGKTAGFCGGVKRSIEETQKVLKKYHKVDCLGELVHNSEVIKRLEQQGLTIIEDMEQANGRVIFRAHGVTKQIYEKAKQMELEVIDLTCPKVLRIHQMAQEYAKQGLYIILIAEKEHPETIGTFSFCGDDSCIIEKEEEIEEIVRKIEESGKEKIAILSQTTFHLGRFQQYVEQFQTKLEKKELVINNTICDATRCRQKETEWLAKEVECMIIIGGKKSSNSHKLYEVARKNCPSTFFIETSDQLEKEKILQFDSIGIMAGASTPQKSIDEVVEELRRK